jgi:1-phosphatidylinositol-4-phosphate 5-kinase
VEREAQNAPRESVPHTNSNSFSHRNTTSQESGRKSGSHNMRNSGNNSTVQRNENDALNSESKETDRPDPRMISTVRSPSVERSGGLQGQTLPVVEEMGEASSTGGRSARSREREDGEQRPLTPAKDNIDERPLTPAKDYNPNGNGAFRRPLSRSSLDKDLPPLPKVSSPTEMSPMESALR